MNRVEVLLAVILEPMQLEKCKVLIFLIFFFFWHIFLHIIVTNCLNNDNYFYLIKCDCYGYGIVKLRLIENLFFVNWFLIWLTGESIGSDKSQPTLYAFR